MFLDSDVSCAVMKRLVFVYIYIYTYVRIYIYSLVTPSLSPGLPPYATYVFGVDEFERERLLAVSTVLVLVGNKERLLREVRLGSFIPDATRSGRFPGGRTVFLQETWTM